MISIIVASVNPIYLEKLTLNIAQKIGVPYELLVFENEAQKGLCELYNLGAEQAKYELLCYMHEDIEISSDNWGCLVADYFKRSDLGILGLAGSGYKSFVPSGWGADDPKKSLNFRNFVQHFKRIEQTPFHEYFNPNQSSEAEVVTLDGMWFCTTKSVCKEFPFDELTLKGFHGYDLDFCLSVGRKYKLLVIYDVLLTHFSEGGYNKDWIEDTLALHHKWNNTLPRNSVQIARKQKMVIEFRNLRGFIRRLIALDYDRNRILEVFDNYQAKLSWYFRIKLKFYLYKAFLKQKKDLVQ